MRGCIKGGVPYYHLPFCVYATTLNVLLDFNFVFVRFLIRTNYATVYCILQIKNKSITEVVIIVMTVKLHP